jgi:hypothetical protein
LPIAWHSSSQSTASDETFSALTWLSAEAVAAAVSAGLLDLLHHAWANGPDHDLHSCAVAGVTLVALPAFAACAVALAAGELAGEGQLPEDRAAAAQQQARELQHAFSNLFTHVLHGAEPHSSTNLHLIDAAIESNDSKPDALSKSHHTGEPPLLQPT